MTALSSSLIVIATVVAMELVARYSHEFIMHGWGWAWHKSHHEPHDSPIERNDLYAVVFAVPSILLIYFGVELDHWLLWVGVGMTTYGLLYFLFHDALVHNRWPFQLVPKGRYMKRIVQAHRMHHAVRTREGCVSFGFLYAPSIHKLKAELRARNPGISNDATREADAERPDPAAS
jgi:beta-carotene 3-hydroxylase